MCVCTCERMCVRVCALRTHEAGEEEAAVKTPRRPEVGVGFERESSVWRSERGDAAGAGNGAREERRRRRKQSARGQAALRENRDEVASPPRLFR